MVSKAKAIKALEDIAQTIRTAVVAKAPRSAKGSGTRKPGNLKDKLYAYNTPQRILGAKRFPTSLIKTGKFNLKFSIEVSPPGAEYGKFWNKPTVSKTVKNGKTSNVPQSIDFVQKAFRESEVRKKIKELGPIIASIVGQEVMEDLRKP